MFGTRRQHIPSISAAAGQELIPLPSLLARRGVHFHFITSQWSELASVSLTDYVANALPSPGKAAGRWERSRVSPKQAEILQKGARGRREEEINCI